MIITLNNSQKALLLKTNYIGHLGYLSNNQLFIVPITYFYNEEHNNIICYSGNGHKTKALRKKNTVSLYVSVIDSVKRWESVLVQGSYEEHNGSDAKAILHQFSSGVKNIIWNQEHRNLDFINQFSSKIYDDDIPVVFTIKIDVITGKRREFQL
ncbi:pyridoxamine 5'-phosphate oxidase family protein [Nonlabens sp.]|uniref:pyridoxamine 5'-phosphate oxidase family protein n=1 Tax=Nonlabens sp. TaxID=1888209 RepID=UPI00260063F7|nr:pyridoxamine 5'-phosphate oxidase family protein [Nonlabens sp.]